MLSVAKEASMYDEGFRNESVARMCSKSLRKPWRQNVENDTVTKERIEKGIAYDQTRTKMYKTNVKRW